MLLNLLQYYKLQHDIILWLQHLWGNAHMVNLRGDQWHRLSTDGAGSLSMGALWCPRGNTLVESVTVSLITVGHIFKPILLKQSTYHFPSVSPSQSSTIPWKAVWSKIEALRSCDVDEAGVVGLPLTAFICTLCEMVRFVASHLLSDYFFLTYTWVLFSELTELVDSITFSIQQFLVYLWLQKWDPPKNK